MSRELEIVVQRMYETHTVRISAQDRETREEVGYFYVSPTLIAEIFAEAMAIAPDEFGGFFEAKEPA